MIGSIFIVILNALICFCFFRLTASYIIQYLMNNNAEKKGSHLRIGCYLKNLERRFRNIIL